VNSKVKQTTDVHRNLKNSHESILVGEVPLVCGGQDWCKSGGIRQLYLSEMRLSGEIGGATLEGAGSKY